jgi:hypothetical protein
MVSGNLSGVFIFHLSRTPNENMVTVVDMIRGRVLTKMKSCKKSGENNLRFGKGENHQGFFIF